MIRTLFKILFRIALVAGTVLSVLALLRLWDEQRADYIEIYNDDNAEGIVY